MHHVLLLATPWIAAGGGGAYLRWATAPVMTAMRVGRYMERIRGRSGRLDAR